MRNLLNFLFRYNHCIVFVLLQGVSFLLLFSFNNYQHSRFFTSANAFVGKIYEATRAVTGYFDLQRQNDVLMERNIWLEQQLLLADKRLKEMEEASTTSWPAETTTTMFQSYKAGVIKNSLNRADNYITLNQGSLAGIKPDMGVIGPNGVVGIVYKTSPHYSLVISLLSSKSNLSCKIAGNEYFGFLQWEGGDSRYAYLKDLPRHAEFAIGDTIVTSGFSTVFPQGMMVGVIEEANDTNDGLSFLLKIKLATDFGKLRNVHVLAREGIEEQKLLEEKAE
ncbi:MAG: rod shape-determining protein MreC [Bacteroides sp.]|nr:rod shape-determining protein MreC [Bacteroides sp.]